MDFAYRKLKKQNIQDAVLILRNLVRILLSPIPQIKLFKFEVIVQQELNFSGKNVCRTFPLFQLLLFVHVSFILLCTYYLFFISFQGNDERGILKRLFEVTLDRGLRDYLVGTLISLHIIPFNIIFFHVFYLLYHLIHIKEITVPQVS